MASKMFKEDVMSRYDETIAALKEGDLFDQQDDPQVIADEFATGWQRQAMGIAVVQTNFGVMEITLSRPGISLHVWRQVIPSDPDLLVIRDKMWVLLDTELDASPFAEETICHRGFNPEGLPETHDNAEAWLTWWAQRWLDQMREDATTKGPWTIAAVALNPPVECTFDPIDVSCLPIEAEIQAVTWLA